MRLTVVTSLAAGLAAVVLSAVTSAQVDPRLTAIVDEMKAFTEHPEPGFIREEITVAVNGQVQEKSLQEIWVRDMEHIRVERSDGMVMVYTPDDIKLFVGTAKVLLHVPKETLTALGDERWEALKEVGITRPRAMFDLVIEGYQHLTITGEDEIAGDDCWVLTADEELAPRFSEVLGGIPPGFTFKTVQMSIGKELPIPRGFFFEMTGPAQLEVGVIVEEYDDSVQVGDEKFTFEAPEGATTLTWTPDKTGEQMKAELDGLAQGGG